MERAVSLEQLAGISIVEDSPPVAPVAVPRGADVNVPRQVREVPINPALARRNAVLEPMPPTPAAQVARWSPLPGVESPAMSPLPATTEPLPVDRLPSPAAVAQETHSLSVDRAQRPETATARALLHDVSAALRERIEVTVATGSVNLEISDNILFPVGSATLTDNGYAVLDELAGVLKDQPYVLSVEGHTDNKPIETELFPSNWELSSARAARVTRSLIQRGVAADRIRAIGYGDTRPRADNGDAGGRSRNRRVSFVLHVE
jgi:chemotaxis protein MotB